VFLFEPAEMREGSVFHCEDQSHQEEPVSSGDCLRTKGFQVLFELRHCIALELEASSGKAKARRIPDRLLSARRQGLRGLVSTTSCEELIHVSDHSVISYTKRSYRRLKTRARSPARLRACTLGIPQSVGLAWVEAVWRERMSLGHANMHIVMKLWYR
jgi:hypothetical protein